MENTTLGPLEACEAALHFVIVNLSLFSELNDPEHRAALTPDLYLEYLCVAAATQEPAEA